MFNKQARDSDGSGALATRTDHPLGRLRDEFEGLFERYLGRSLMPFSSLLGNVRTWSLDVDDKGKELLVRAEAPGFEANDFDIQVNGNLLVIRAEHKDEKEEKKDNYQVRENRYGRFERTVPLPTATDADNVTARYRNGVLEIHLPKTEPTEQKRIEVKT